MSDILKTSAAGCFIGGVVGGTAGFLSPVPGGLAAGAWKGCGLGTVVANLVGCGGTSSSPSPTENPCQEGKELECREAQSKLQQLVRTSTPHFTVPLQSKVENFCHAQYLPTANGYNGIHLRIDANYPYHPSSICRNPAEIKNPVVINFDQVPSGAVILKLGVVSFVGGGGDESKQLDLERVAGRPLTSFVAISVSSLEEAQKICPSYSPLRPQSYEEEITPLTRNFFTSHPEDYPYSTEPPPSRDDYALLFNQISANTRAFVQSQSRVIPTPAQVNFLLATQATRYWGACQAGMIEVEATPVGGRYTHSPDKPLFGSYDDANPPQCEAGGWAQVYEYVNRPIVALDGSAQGFPKDTQYVCVRTLETDPTPHLQGVIDIAQLTQNGEVTLGHDSLNPSNIQTIYGASGRNLHDSTLQAITIVAEKKP